MAKSQKTRIVLFVYGGGMRGMVAAHILARIEAMTGLAMADMVDIFTGPSTGSILNAALVTPATDYPVWHPSARPRFKAEHMVKFYEREGLRIFPRDRFRSFRGFVHDVNNRTVKIAKIETMFKRGHYDPSRLAQALRRLYGETSLNQTLRSLIIPVFNVEGDTQSGRNNIPDFFNKSGEALWLRHIEGSLEPEANMDVKLYDAVLGSCAAPTYFPCHSFNVHVPGASDPLSCSGIDGSVFDSPPVTWHGAVRPYIQPDERVVTILVGTGYTGRSFQKEEWNRFGGLGIVDPRNDLPLINILFRAPELALMDGFVRDMGDDLFVFNRSLQTGRGGPDTPSIQIDDASPENLSRMTRFADSILEENEAQLDKLCDILVQGRDRHRGEKENIWRRMQKRWFYPQRSQVQ
ncbi:MAG: patatin-like phospholipase family protein [Alphaproteobacteria bacterium]|nr:patatin-like phospholipase family protein [Alphaproteobacteria bacterium]